MIKSFGVFAFLAYLLLCTQLGGFASGFSIYFLCALTLVFGAVALICFTATEDVLNGAFKEILKPLPMTAQKLIEDLEDLSSTIRRDGLLTLEAKRKDIKDAFLRYLLKKVMDGFEKAQLLPVLRNQALRRAELIRTAESFLERLNSLLPTLGLLPCLFMIMDFLNQGKSSATINSLPTVFIPFALALLIQMVLSAWSGRFFDQLKEDVKLYYVIMEEGVSGIQDGMNPELLKDKLRARFVQNPKWSES